MEKENKLAIKLIALAIAGSIGGVIMCKGFEKDIITILSLGAVLLSFSFIQFGRELEKANPTQENEEHEDG